MRVRLQAGELRFYTGSKEKMETLTIQEIKSFLKRKNPYVRMVYLSHMKKHGYWVCVNSIDKTRRKIEWSEK